MTDTMKRPVLKRRAGRPAKREKAEEWTPKGAIKSREWSKNHKNFTPAEKEYYYKECRKDGIRDPEIEEDIESVREKLAPMDLTHTGIFNTRTPSEKAYSPDQKVLAVMTYALSGNLLSASIKSSVPYPTILAWKNRSPWWPKVLEEIRRTKCEEFDLKCTALMDNMLEHMAKKLMDDGGDEVVLRDGTKVKKTPDLHRLASTLAILFDKRALGRGEVTSRTEKVDPKKRLDDLAKQFKDITGERIKDNDESK